MLACSHCGYKNRVGSLFCEDCGRNLLAGAGSTPVTPTRRLMDAPEETSARATWGPARIGSNTSIVLQVRDAPQPITLNPGQRMILGRSDPQSTVQPDVDMNPYGAVEKGVSRQHAILEFNEDTLMLLDAGSANGTFLNGQRLPPNQPRVVRDGDEVRLGKLVAYLYFK